MPTLDDGDNDRCFIEAQFPVVALSLESHKERKSVGGQTLTGLGKWWGRKPLVLIRAILLGLALPATRDAKGDLDTFLRLMTMDPEGRWRRSRKGQQLEGRPERRKECEAARAAFDSEPLERQLTAMLRPEQVEGPSEAAWEQINNHLGTQAQSLPELIRELGEKRLGHRPSVSDPMCGGGAIPFEAARLGCDVEGSDLNPVAALLSWSSLHLGQLDPPEREALTQMMETIAHEAQAQMEAWGLSGTVDRRVETAVIRCIEVTCDGCGMQIPVAPNWEIHTKTGLNVDLVCDDGARRTHCSVGTWPASEPTVSDGRIRCPKCNTRTSVEDKRREMRRWTNEDVAPRTQDVFKERTVLIRWALPTLESLVEEAHGGRTNDATNRTRWSLKDDLEAVSWGWTEDEQAQLKALVNKKATDHRKTLKALARKAKTRVFLEPDANDDAREALAGQRAEAVLEEWQARGWIPNARIEKGIKTGELNRTRGWTHWHHCESPWQLLVTGLLMQGLERHARTPEAWAIGLLGIHRVVDYGSKMTRWNKRNENIENTYYNQALNTLWNWAERRWPKVEVKWHGTRRCSIPKDGNTTRVTARDFREEDGIHDWWITDPPYQDAVMYHELTELWIAWTGQVLHHVLPDIVADSRRTLAVHGARNRFRAEMVEGYRKLVSRTNRDGRHVILFTHKDARVWAEMALILWAAGLKVTAAWTIRTETTSGLKRGDYVQGTVVLIARVRDGAEAGNLQRMKLQLQRRIPKKIEEMRSLAAESAEAIFNDPAYALAGYAAALEVLTSYSTVEGMNLNEALHPEGESARRAITAIIEDAVSRATTLLVARFPDVQISATQWQAMSAGEQCWLKVLEAEIGGDRQEGTAQEYARSFHVTDLDKVLAERGAHSTRVATPSELKAKQRDGTGLAGSVLRAALYGVYLTTGNDGHPRQAVQWLETRATTEGGLARMRPRLLVMLRIMEHVKLKHWKGDAQSARVLGGALARGEG